MKIKFNDVELDIEGDIEVSIDEATKTIKLRAKQPEQTITCDGSTGHTELGPVSFQ